MNQEEINKRNEAIALFMGMTPRWVTYPDSALNRWEIDKDNCWQHIQYHSSWDWLMPAASKVEKPRLIKHDHPYFRLCKALLSFDLEAAFIAVSDYFLTLKKD